MQHENVIKKRRRIFTVVFTVLMSGASMASHSFSYAMAGFSNETFPLLLVGALCGNLPGIISVLMALIFRTVTDSLTSYVIALYLLAVLITAGASSRRFFRSIRKALLLGVCITLIIGAGHGLILNITTAGEFASGTALRTLVAFAYSLPESEMAMIAAYLLLKYLPDSIKIFIPNGIYYIDGNEDLYSGIDERIKEMRSRLSSRVTGVVVIESTLLTILAAIIAIHLVSILNTETIGMYRSVSQDMAAGLITEESRPEESIPEDMVRPPELTGKPVDPNEQASDDRNDSPPAPRTGGILGEAVGARVSGNGIFNDSERFNPFVKHDVLDSKMIWAFSIRLVMILFTAGIITAAIADAYMQYTVARPIRKMSDAMNGFAFSERDGSIGGTEELSDIKIHSKDEIEELYHALVKTVADTE